MGGILRFFMKGFYSWESIMNLKYNPFRFIGDISLQCYYMTVLSIVWSATFSAMIAGWAGLLPLIFGHVAVVFATYFTYSVFYDARKDQKSWFVKANRSYIAEKNKDRRKNICRWNLDVEA